MIRQSTHVYVPTYVKEKVPTGISHDKIYNRYDFSHTLISSESIYVLVGHTNLFFSDMYVSQPVESYAP